MEVSVKASTIPSLIDTVFSLVIVGELVEVSSTTIVLIVSSYKLFLSESVGLGKDGAVLKDNFPLASIVNKSLSFPLSIW